VGLAEERRQGRVTSVLAIDPGSFQSAWLQYDGSRPTAFGITANDILVKALRSDGVPDVVVIEEMRSFMRRVGGEVFDTVRWAGIFEEAVRPTPVVLLGRKDVVVHLCGSAAANDADVRAALLDRFGGKDAAIGRKGSPGPLSGISRDVWSALAIAVMYTIAHGSVHAA
jgi:hypothetical protein